MRLMALIGLLAMVGCASAIPAPQMAFQHIYDGRYYCAACTPGTQDPNDQGEPIIFIYETTTLGCPDVTVEELLEE